MIQKSRLLFIMSWLMLRLHWSLIFLQASVSKALLQRSWIKPGIILFARQHDRFPTDCWHFDGHRSAYLYVEAEKPLLVYFLPEYSSN
jgi:hypothetical protein